MGIGENIKEIQHNIKLAAQKSGRRAEDILLLAVTKTVAPERIAKAIECGIKSIGENKAQELVSKYEALGKELDYHFIGHLQSNKVKYIADKVSLIHSVDSFSLAEEINKQAKKLNKILNILIEINIGGEISKSGLKPDEAEEILKKISVLESVKVKGLMTIPPFSQNFEETRQYFKRMFELFIDIRAKKLDNVSMDFLSMGMSMDYTLAIEEGSNIVRIGSSIFGERK
jgi:pyridoxal phosphate enzyme (YggS family)